MMTPFHAALKVAPSDWATQGVCFPSLYHKENSQKIFFWFLWSFNVLFGSEGKDKQPVSA